MTKPFIQCIFVSIMFHLLLISLEEACTDPSMTFIASGCLYIGIVQTESDGLIHRLPGPMPGSQDFRLFQTLHSSFLPVAKFSMCGGGTFRLAERRGDETSDVGAVSDPRGCINPEPVGIGSKSRCSLKPFVETC